MRTKRRSGIACGCARNSSRLFRLLAGWTVPIVRNTGGLADTVFDADYAHKPFRERNGYVFNDYNWQGLESALQRAIGLWQHYPQYFRELVENGMRYDYSWNNPGQHYLNIYNHIKAP